MSDLVERLRESGSRSEVELYEDREEAADRITELEAQRDELLGVLGKLLVEYDDAELAYDEPLSMLEAVLDARAAIAKCEAKP